MSVLPRAARPFVTFPALLRANGFAVAPEQTTAFLTAVGLLGPKSVADIRRAAHATLAPPPERRAAFDALFARYTMERERDVHREFLHGLGLASKAVAPSDSNTDADDGVLLF